MRAFLALNINDQVREHLEEIQGLIKLTNRGKGTYSRAENFHMSLAFLDEISTDQAEVLVRLLGQQLEEHGPFELVLDKLGYFGSEDCATVWCAVRPDNRLKALVSDVYRTVRDARIHFDSKPFKAHITLGRKINIMNCRLSDIEVQPLVFTADRVTLFRSTLRPDGPVYDRVADIFL